MQNSKSARDTIATIQIKTPRKCANTQNTNVIKQNSTNARKIESSTVNRPFTLSNYKHDAYAVLLMLKSGM